MRHPGAIGRNTRYPDDLWSGKPRKGSFPAWAETREGFGSRGLMAAGDESPTACASRRVRPSPPCLPQTPAILDQVDGGDIDTGFIEQGHDDVADGDHLPGGTAFQFDPDVVGQLDVQGFHA